MPAVQRLEATGMKYVFLSNDPEVLEARERAFFPDDEVVLAQNWQQALESSEGADMMFVDLIATLAEPHKIAGYEAFAEAKMSHPTASAIPLVLIWPPEDYALDFMTGFPNFVFQSIQRPVTFQKLRRATTYV
jgi:hypothetical protein